ncbi:type I-E CRISPR-associated protein Cas5/CasD [Filomicrobium sp.]|uniref:type I-E CRISPR-associated protein Cas5/CasD n=1 Tax=Filomicrobium sp. TaxID=2024831 RepID=UPI0025868D2F|nr:type I-E CRISPR-associated protein Cas5/CasD [Filomicrobium sp.]MCV0371797.1 type I-E CRISPR-associated protein Cas5/CasD [Filomicrobium sp.]
MSMSPARRWLVLRLEAPLLSFGAVAIDNYGVTWDFPALSMLTGLFANALGYERIECEAHQALQDRIVFASRREDEPYHGVLTDVQNVHMQKSDKGWTTRGTPEGRDGGSYGGPHRRFRDYHPDALVAVVLTLHLPPDHALPAGRHHPTLDDLAAALDRPERPLFIGRKPCLPAWPLNAGLIEAETAHDALLKLPALMDLSKREPRKTGDLRAQWPAGDGPDQGAGVDRGLAIHDRRNWISGLHGGTRRVIEGRLAPPAPPPTADGEVAT